MKPAKVIRILIEEAIRAMALFGVLFFGGVVHLVRLFNVPAGPALLGALGFALLGFVVFVAMRLKTGREFKVASRRGVIILGALIVFEMLLLQAVHVMLDPEARWEWWKLLGIIGVAAFFAWFTTHEFLGGKTDVRPQNEMRRFNVRTGGSSAVEGESFVSRLKLKNMLAAAVLVIVILGGGFLAVWLSGPSPGAALSATILERIRGETPQAKMHAYVRAVLRGDEEAALDAWVLQDPDLSNGRSDALRERRQDVSRELIAADLDADYMITEIEWWTTCCEPSVTCDARNAGGARIHVQFLDRDGLPLAYVFDVFHSGGSYWGAAAGYPPRQWTLYDVYPRDEEPLFWRYVYEPTVRRLDWAPASTPTVR